MEFIFCRGTTLPPFKDLTGQVFGRLTVVSLSHMQNNAYWNCVCECGASSVVNSCSLISKNTSSCGCLRKEALSAAISTHRLTNHPLHKVWLGIKDRCYAKSRKHYKDYGGRGISVCSEWHDLHAFFEWGMASGYKKGLTIDRIDTDGNYSPENCRWATAKEQCNNRRNNIQVTYHGVLQPFALLFGADKARRSKVWTRISRGWDVDKAVDTP